MSEKNIYCDQNKENTKINPENLTEEEIGQRKIEENEMIEKEEEKEIEEKEMNEGIESELVLEDDIEGYEETTTGMKIKYVLSEEEITEIFKHTEGYEKNKQLQKRHTIIQSVLFVILMFLWIFLKNNYYGFLMIMPLICIGVIWGVPILSMKRLARDFFSGEEINAEIYPDKISLKVRDKEREIPLDSSVKYEELGGMIMLYPAEKDTVMIPIRAIDPEFLPDIQAMIFAGAVPKYEK